MTSGSAGDRVEWIGTVGNDPRGPMQAAIRADVEEQAVAAFVARYRRDLEGMLGLIATAGEYSLCGICDRSRLLSGDRASAKLSVTATRTR